MPELLSVLGAPCPNLRDTLGWSTLSIYFRSKLCPSEVRLELFKILLTEGFLFWKITAGESSESVCRSFSSLALADLLCGDSLHGLLLTPEDLESSACTICLYLSLEKDLRGFDEKLGWIHAIAHVGDCLDALITHPHCNEKTIKKCFLAILDYIDNRGSHVFNWNEEFRLGCPLASAMHVFSDEILELILVQRYPRSKLLEMPAFQNLLNTWRCAYLELHWKNINRANMVESLKNLIR